MSISDSYIHSENSTITYCPFDVKTLASGNLAVVDYFGKVLRIVTDPEEADQEAEAASMAEHSCVMCDGLGHAFIIGWEHFDNGTSRVVLGGGSCPLEDRGWMDQDDPYDHDHF